MPRHLPPPPKPQTFAELVQERGVSLEELLDFLYSRRDYLTQEHQHRLIEILTALGGEMALPLNTGETLNLKEQVHKLWITVDILLNEEVDYGKKQLRNPGNSRSTTEVLAKATSLASLLAKLYEDVTNQSILHQTEMATIAALKKFPDLHEAFLAELQVQLGKVT